MSNEIKLKRGSGSDPSASDLVVGELAIRTDLGKIFTKKDNGNVAEISGGGGIDDGDKGDITVSNAGDTWTIDNGVVTSAKIADGTIVNADISSSAAIAGSKIDPDFGSQNIVTTGSTSSAAITATGLLKISNTFPRLLFEDTNNNDDFSIYNANGTFRINDDTNNAARLDIDSSGTVDIFGNLDVGGGLDVTGGGLTVNTGTTNTCATFTSTDAGAVINITDNSARSSIEQNGTDLKIIADTDAGDANSTIRFLVDNSTKMLINSSGNVGIGTTTVDRKLHVKSAGLIAKLESTTANSLLMFATPTNETAGTIPNIGADDNDLAFTTGNIERLRINSSGNVGIANTSPSEKLDVTGNIAVSGTVDGVDIAARNTLFGGLTSSSGVLTNGVTATTQSAGDSSTKIATTAYTDTAIANLIDSSPSTLNTLNELASALGDDPNFATTVTNSIATKMPLAGGIFTGDVTFDGETAGRDIVFDRSDNALEFADNAQAKFGSNRLKIRFNGTESIIEDSSDLYILGDPIQLRRPNGDKYVQCIASNAVKLFFNGNEKIATTNTGVDVTGNIAVSGTVDGRDLATDGSKLDGIESGATADQSASEILTLIKTVDGSGSGLDADLLDGYNQSDSAGNNTIVRRNASGYIFSNYIHTTDNSVTSGVAEVMVKTTGGGDYHRSASAGAIRTFINVENGATADQSASEILTLIKTVDGAGSGLDADTLDGVSSASFLRSDANDTSSGTIAFGTGALDPDSFASFSGGFGHIQDGSGWAAKGVFVHGGGTGDAAAIAHNGSKLYFGIQNGSSANTMATWLDVTPSTRVINFQTANNATNVQIGGNKIFHAGNDGAGSTLDADLLDGVQGSSFLRSDAADTATGNLTFNGVVAATNEGNTPDKIGNYKICRVNGAISSIDDLDSFLFSKIDGSYPSGTKPSGSHNGVGIISMQTHTGDYFTQLALSTQTNDLFIRSANNSTSFGSWEKLWSEGNDGSGSGLDADTLDGVEGSSFVRSDAADTLSATYNFSNSSSNDIINFSANSSSDNRGIAFNNRTALSADYNDGYLRLNNLQEFSNGVYTPLVMRADGGFNVDGIMSINGSGNYVKALSTASDYSSLLRSNADDIATHRIQFQNNATDNEDTIATGSGSQGGIEIYNTGAGNDAFMAFHSGGDFACYFGLDADINDIAVGGWSMGANKYRIWHQNNDGSGSGLDADTVDGVHGSSFLRSDTTDTASGAITFNGDVGFNGGAYAAHIEAGSDIAFHSGNWTGNHTKIQNHSNYLYIVGASNGIIFREDGTDRWIIDGSGHLIPNTDSTYNIGENGRRVTNGYFDTLYGDGSNLTGISAGATGGGSDEVFYENGQTVTTNYTITNGKNAMAAGPITINSGVTLTVGSGENLTIV